MCHEFIGVIDTFNKICSKGLRIFISLFFIVLLLVVAVMVSLLRLKIFLQTNFASQEIIADLLQGILCDIFLMIFICIILLWVFFIVAGLFLLIKTATSQKVK
ncbi:hypothetical protein P378_00215 [Desulforamulus profundi]|uniref:Uncharacterized protein n=1 Tax=Desulforamulus profundi TaxID=1383067 RepID=A0A2C6MF43_9FIRM|nr:hypothetical protein [Desulforamulus profundi]PHJ39979.1 hypothetical protein P378_00215 [Desulforamulus profundi]